MKCPTTAHICIATCCVVAIINCFLLIHIIQNRDDSKALHEILNALVEQKERHMRCIEENKKTTIALEEKYISIQRELQEINNCRRN